MFSWFCNWDKIFISYLILFICGKLKFFVSISLIATYLPLLLIFRLFLHLYIVEKEPLLNKKCEYKKNKDQELLKNESDDMGVMDYL